jgi:hypothetical protein
MGHPARDVQGADPLIPNRFWQNLRLYGGFSGGKGKKGKTLFCSQKSALSEKISICAAPPAIPPTLFKRERNDYCGSQSNQFRYADL